MLSCCFGGDKLTGAPATSPRSHPPAALPAEEKAAEDILAAPAVVSAAPPAVTEDISSVQVVLPSLTGIAPPEVAPAEAPAQTSQPTGVLAEARALPADPVNSSPTQANPEAGAEGSPAAPQHPAAAIPSAVQKVAAENAMVSQTGSGSNMAQSPQVPPWFSGRVVATEDAGIGGVPAASALNNGAQEATAAAASNGPATGGANIMDSAGAANINDILRLNLGEVKLVLQKLAGVNSTPSIALNEASELLCKHLSVNYCRCEEDTSN
jgi:hypothetical protein